MNFIALLANAAEERSGMLIKKAKQAGVKAGVKELLKVTGRLPKPQLNSPQEDAIDLAADGVLFHLPATMLSGAHGAGVKAVVLDTLFFNRN